eukprot:15424-Heterococcus_DN1.PRE.4
MWSGAYNAYALLDNFHIKNDRPLQNERRVKFTLHTDSAHVCPTTDLKKGWLLVSAAPHGRKQAVYFQDGLNCDCTWCNNLAQIIDVQSIGAAVVLNVQINKRTPAPADNNNNNNHYNDAADMDADDDDEQLQNDGWPRTEGEVFYLYQRYVNLYIVQKVMDRLKALDSDVQAANGNENNNSSSSDDNHDSLGSNATDIARPDMPLFIRLVQNPTAWDTDNRANDTLCWGVQLNTAQQQQ